MVSESGGFTKVGDGGAYGYTWRSPRWRCDVCGRTGFGTDGPYRWADACRRGHSPCPWCGRQLALRMDGTPRVHSKCSERPDEAELLRLVVAEARTTARYGVRGPLNGESLALLTRLTAIPQSTPTAQATPSRRE